MEDLGLLLRVPLIQSGKWEHTHYHGTAFFSLIQYRVATECGGSIRHRTLSKKRRISPWDPVPSKWSLTCLPQSTKRPFWEPSIKGFFLPPSQVVLSVGCFTLDTHLFIKHLMSVYSCDSFYVQGKFLNTRSLVTLEETLLHPQWQQSFLDCNSALG